MAQATTQGKAAQITIYVPLGDLRAVLPQIGVSHATTTDVMRLSHRTNQICTPLVYNTGDDEKGATKRVTMLLVDIVPKCWNPHCDVVARTTTVALGYCYRCGVARYCSADCLLMDWNVHRIKCGKLRAQNMPVVMSQPVRVATATSAVSSAAAAPAPAHATATTNASLVSNSFSMNTFAPISPAPAISPVTTAAVVPTSAATATTSALVVSSISSESTFVSINFASPAPAPATPRTTSSASGKYDLLEEFDFTTKFVNSHRTSPTNSNN